VAGFCCTRWRCFPSEPKRAPLAFDFLPFPLNSPFPNFLFRLTRPWLLVYLCNVGTLCYSSGPATLSFQRIGSNKSPPSAAFLVCPRRSCASFLSVRFWALVMFNPSCIRRIPALFCVFSFGSFGFDPFLLSPTDRSLPLRLSLARPVLFYMDPPYARRFFPFFGADLRDLDLPTRIVPVRPFAPLRRVMPTLLPNFLSLPPFRVLLASCVLYLASFFRGKAAI